MSVLQLNSEAGMSPLPPGDNPIAVNKYYYTTVHLITRVIQKYGFCTYRFSSKVNANLTL